MDLLFELLKKIIYLIPIVLIAALLFIFIRFVFKSLGIAPTLKSYVSHDYLPAPGSYGTLNGKAPTPSDKQTMPSMEDLNPWMKTGSYTYEDKTVVYTEANSQVRNIRIGENNTISSGSIISGTAREVFFSNGKFFVILLNKTGQVIAQTVAIANKSADSSIWIPWQAKFGLLSQQISGECTLILESQNNTSNPEISKIIKIPVDCTQ